MPLNFFASQDVLNLLQLILGYSLFILGICY